MTEFGYTCEPSLSHGHRDLYPFAGYRRFFYDQARVSWQHGPLTSVAETDYPVISTKRYIPADLETLCAQAAAPFTFVIQHEPEDEISAGRLSISALAAQYASARAIVDEANGPVVGASASLAVILNWRQGVKRGFKWSTLAPVLELADVIGMDCYPDATDAARDVYTSADEMFDPLAVLADAYGKPFAVTEFGMTLASDGDGDRFATAMAGYFSYASLAGAEWLSYWCHDAAERDYHLDGNPDMAAGMRVLQGAIAATA